MAEPLWMDESMTATCDQCRAVSKFLMVSPGSGGTYERSLRHVATIIEQMDVKFEERLTTERFYFLRCAGCGRAALASVLLPESREAHLARVFEFYPRAIERAELPRELPEGVQSEFREAERVASIGAHRAATALLRSALEKVLVENGYEKGSLFEKIEQAHTDGVITAARKRQVHDDVRRLGNDIVHEPWRMVQADEYVVARRYVTWILEDFYADRPTVEGVLRDHRRIPPAPVSD